VPGAETLQFRDVEGVSAKVAYLQSIGDNPTDFRIYKTVDGGATWTMQFRNQIRPRSTIASPSGHRNAPLAQRLRERSLPRPADHRTARPGRTSAATCRRRCREKRRSPRAAPAWRRRAVRTPGLRPAARRSRGPGHARRRRHLGGARHSARELADRGAFTVAFRNPWAGIVGAGTWTRPTRMAQPRQRRVMAASRGRSPTASGERGCFRAGLRARSRQPATGAAPW